MPKPKIELIRKYEKDFTDEELGVIEDVMHETILWYCNQCGNWFESKENILAHYHFADEDYCIENDMPTPHNVYCRNVENGELA